ncbi:hypothetical protein TNCV_4912011 [Trichonephila clavipes]|nr:hypothetical protein TNCV_4912011 [Trichonephila clavipes]
MDVCKCIVPSRYGDILNCCRAEGLLYDRWKGKRGGRPLNPSGAFPQNLDGTEQNHVVTCMVLKAEANDRRKNIALSGDEFRVP